MRIRTKVEIILNTDGTWEVTRFLSGPTKQVKLGTKKPLFAGGIRRKEYPTPTQDKLDNARRKRREARRNDWSDTTRKLQQCSWCKRAGLKSGYGANVRTCNRDGSHRPAHLYRGDDK